MSMKSPLFVALLIAATVLVAGCATNSTPQASPNELSAAPFHCKDLLPDSDFNRIIGQDISNFVVNETDDRNSITSDLSCHYYTPLNFSGGSYDFVFLVEYRVSRSTPKAVYEKEKNSLLSNSITRGDVVEIHGLGSDAYQWATTITTNVLSSNQKYAIISVVLGYDNFMFEVTKVVDANLNKY